VTDFLKSIPWRDLALFVAIVTFLTIAGFVRGWWVVGKRYDEMTTDRNYWRDRFFDSIGLVEKATKIAAEEIGL
jgi:hypothetical protein